MFHIFVRLIRDASWRGATRVSARQETQLKLQVVSYPAISTTILPRRVKWLYYADSKRRWAEKSTPIMKMGIQNSDDYHYEYGDYSKCTKLFNVLEG